MRELEHFGNFMFWLLIDMCLISIFAAFIVFLIAIMVMAIRSNDNE